MSARINYLREKRALCNKIKCMALNTNGIIFGGMVRDDIIGKHYRNQFIKRGMDFEKYWDTDYDIETKYRVIVPNDIDIFFRADNNTANFINKLREFVKEFKGKVIICNDTDNFNRFNYSDTNVYLKRKIVEICLEIGRTLVTRGRNITLKIDLIEINYNHIHITNDEFIRFTDKIEPPFNNLDLMCNVFIMERNRSNEDCIRISNCTGTPIDDMVFTEKISYSAKIIDDIINFRTKFARKCDNYYSEYVNSYRILKMIDRTFGWNITNIPFKLVCLDEIPLHEISSEDKCCICLENINSNNELVALNTNKSKRNYLHRHCFIEYLWKENMTKYVDLQTNKIQCRCPFRNFFNFKDCYKSIEYI